MRSEVTNLTLTRHVTHMEPVINSDLDKCSDLIIKRGKINCTIPCVTLTFFVVVFFKS